MARFELNGAPNKETPGAVGDICTDTLTMKKYKLSSITKRYAYGKSHIEYHWVDFNDVESLSDRIEVLEQGGISEEAAERIIAEKMNEMGSLTADQINALIDDKANVSDIQTINDEIDEINEKLENFDGNIDLTDYAKVEDVYTKDEIDAKGYLTEIPDNYATTDDLNLKANVDEVYSIDEIDAKGFLTEIPDEYVTNDELDLKANAADVYTKAEIDAMGALTEIPDEYITEDELTAKGYATQDDLLLKADADKVYTKDEIDAMGALTEIPDEYITEDELTAKGYATQDDLLLKADADKVYTKDEIDAMGALTEIPDEYITETELADMGLATETFVTTKIAEAALEGSDVDLSGYATKDDLLLKADADKVYTKEEIDAMGALTEIPDEYITEEELTAKGYATQDDLLLKADADSVYTKEEIDAMGALTEIPDEYITEEELTAKGYATQDDLLLKADADSVYTKEEIDAMGYLTEIPDTYATKDDLLLKADADKVYTKEEIDAMGALTEIPDEYITEEELTAKGYATQDDLLLKADADSVYTKEEIDAMGALTEIPDEYITEEELTAKGYLVADDLTDINSRLENATKSSVLRFPVWNGSTDVYLKIPSPTTLSEQSAFITITSSHGGCIVLLAGDSSTTYSFTKCIRLSHDNIWSHKANEAGTEKLLNVYIDKANKYCYVKLGANGSVSILGLNSAPETVSTTPTGVVEIPIVDLTQGGTTDLTEINTKIAQLETKAALIPVVIDNPTDYDLNNYKENGNYSIGDSSKYNNTPETRPGLLTVIRSNSYRMQLYTVVNINNNVYFRISTNWGSSWSSWKLLNGSSGASGGSDIYTDTQQECGTWMGKKLYKRSRYSGGTKASMTDGTKSLFNVDKTLYRVVKIEGVFRFGADSSNTATYLTPFVDFNKSASIVLLQDRDGMICSTYKGLSEYKDYGHDVTVYYTDI